MDKLKAAEIERLKNAIRNEGSMAYRTGISKCPYRLGDALTATHLKGILLARKLWQEGYDRAAEAARKS